MKYFFILFLLGTVVTVNAQKSYLKDLSPAYNPALKPFYHGVASGDPTPEAVILWTKLTPDTDLPALIGWEISKDSLFSTILQQGSATTDESRNWSITVDVTGLEFNTFYFYRFDYQGKKSMVGRTKTAPIGDVQQMKIAVVSCSNFEAGYFNAYAMLAQRTDIDVVLHLGDYIYEYQVGGYGNKKLPRKHIPAREIVALDDYRARYAQYRLDPDLQQVHARFPFINVWDDHEFANDAYIAGAQNHQEKEEGEWSKRKSAARQAYFEWIPVRKRAGDKLYRQFSFGSLADLWMLDERMEGRTKQSESAKDLDFNAESRHMIGTEQFEWLTNGMQQSKARWRILGNQVIMSSLDNSKVFPKNPKFMDMWDGYPAERNRLFHFFESQNMQNIVVVTGDCHTSWVMDLTRAPQDPTQYDKKTGKGVVGIEFTTPSITSANYDEYVKPFLVKIAQRRFTKKGTNPHVRFMDLMHHGYLILTLNQESAQGEWFYMKRINRPNRQEKRGQVYQYSGAK